MRFLWPRSLAGQLTAVLLVILVSAQAVILIILHDERRLALKFAARQYVLTRIVAVVKLMEEAPPNLHGAILASASTPGAEFRVSASPAVAAHKKKFDDDDEEDRLSRNLSRRLAAFLGAENRDVRVIVIESEDDDHISIGGWREGRPFARMFGEPSSRSGDDRHSRMRNQMHMANTSGLVVSLRLSGGRWLNATTRIPPPDMTIAVSSVIAMGVAGLLLILIAVLMVRRVTRPMVRMAHAAERLGRGEDVSRLPEEGPSDIRGTTRAFNDMRERLERFVTDRSRMLAAITHDIRTPITSLRLRAEMVEDEETRQRMLETLEEMQQMTEAALDYAREDAAKEDTRAVDLGALIDALSEDLKSLGRDVTFEGDGRIVLRCRPAALRRAIRNVVENAVRYGKRAVVSLDETAGKVSVYVDDFGPGIPDGEQDRIFEPFVRLEESRSKDTGGIGLGLAIARSIVRGHGGDIEIENRNEGGARFILWLPKSEK
ncbi:MAG: HAMP domain-containing protein [Rhodospirillales bacterium]|nr:HAMP domain-containing protein [Rhodospirillales bacterium]